jgi:uncharacterized protein YcbK (DUF882 family)
MSKLSENFTEKEFRCKCCAQVHPDGMDPELIALLESIRAAAWKQSGDERKVAIVCGYRCSRHNEELRKKDPSVARSSQHLLGTAADIRISGLSPREVAKIANDLMPKKGGIGVYSTFTHVDVRRNKARW